MLTGVFAIAATSDSELPSFTCDQSFYHRSLHHLIDREILHAMAGPWASCSRRSTPAWPAASKAGVQPSSSAAAGSAFACAFSSTFSTRNNRRQRHWGNWRFFRRESSEPLTANPQVHDALVQVVAKAACEAPARTAAQVPTEIKSIIHKTMRRAGDRIQRNLRAQKRLEAAQADMDTMQAVGRYPAGTRPFKCQSDMVELDESLGEAIREKYVFQIEVPQGSSRKEALAITHHAFTKESKRINLEAMKEKVEKEKLRNKRERIF